MCVGEEVKVGDIPKPSLPSILPKKPLPPKTSSSSSFPPRRPERPPTLASVHTQTHTRSDPTERVARVSEPNVVVWFTCSGVKAPSLRAGLRHQILPLTGHMTLVSATSEMETRCLRSLSLSLSLPARVRNLPMISCCLCFCRRGPGRGGVVDGQAESPDGVAATSHRPPASLTDLHASEFVRHRLVRKDESVFHLQPITRPLEPVLSEEWIRCPSQKTRRSEFSPSCSRK